MQQEGECDGKTEEGKKRTLKIKKRRTLKTRGTKRIRKSAWK